MGNKLHIVGLRYHNWSGRMAELFASDGAKDDTWRGQKLFLQRDYQCDADPHAVMAWTLTEPVGHVCKYDLPRIAAVLEQGGRDMLETRIVALDTLRRSLVVETLEELPEMPPQPRKSLEWAWQGPVIPLPAAWAMADHLARMMNLLVQGQLPWNDETAEMVRLYMQYTVTDPSGDAYAERQRLANTLMQSTDPRLNETGHKLLAVMDHMGSTEQMAACSHMLTAAMTATKEAHSLALCYAEVDLQQVLTALRSFPFEIGREWLGGNAERFVRRLYYAQIPRTEILKLMSLIVLYTACRPMQHAALQPAIGLNVGAPCHLNVGTLENHGTLTNIEQARILPNR